MNCMSLFKMMILLKNVIQRPLEELLLHVVVSEGVHKQTHKASRPPLNNNDCI